jgi:acetyl-CoA acetyltransferase
MISALRGRTAIVGIGEAGIPAMPPGSTPIDAMALAAVAALDDAGLRPADVDGIFAAGLQLFMPTLSLAEYLRIAPRYSDGTQIGGGAFLAHLNHAQAALDAGLCTVALIAYGSTQRSGGKRFVSHSEPNPYEQPYRVPGPVASYAMIAGRHMHEFGTTPAQLAEVAVAARQWARITPGATAQAPLAIADVLAARRIAEPLGLLDCCLVTDGAGAVVVTTAERARDRRRDAVYLLGAGEAVSHRGIAQMPDLTATVASESGRRAFVAAGLGPGDVDVLQLYDAFTINPIVFLEDLGFCAKGEGGPFVAGGALAPGGRLPVNTNGGGLSYCHPGMYGIFTIIESVRQLRGGLGARQVAGAEIALAHAPGGYMSSQSTAIFGTAATV